MDKLIYTRGTYSNEIQKVELDVNENIDIHEFKRVCKRLACALGYDSIRVEETFEGKSKPLDKLKQILKG
tara:strand:- start:293 stop:502 length:210 start_codon:yes stop_codon:yes gene_type:complete